MGHRIKFEEGFSGDGGGVESSGGVVSFEEEGGEGVGGGVEMHGDLGEWEVRFGLLVGVMSVDGDGSRENREKRLSTEIMWQ